MKKYALVLMLLVCLSSVGLASDTYDDVYQFPGNINQLLDRTYQMIHQTVEVDESLIYDVFLFDEYFMTLSAITRGEAIGMGLEGIRSYFELSLKKYDLNKQFMVLVMAHDPEDRMSDEDVISQVNLRNSRNQLLKAGLFDKYENVYVFSFSKELVELHTQGDQLINLQLPGDNGKIFETSFKRDYKKAVPWKVWELMNVLKSKDIYELPTDSSVLELID